MEELFGERGACGGCWCMFWRLLRSEFDKNKGAGNKRSLRKLIAAGPAPGLLAYDGRRPVGWIALAPRRDYSALERSRILKPIDDKPVWSISCFFIDKDYRRRGLSVALIRAAVEYAAKKGATLIEGYPQEPRKGALPAAFAWTGLAAAFAQAGFTEAARRSPTRPIMRREA